MKRALALIFVFGVGCLVSDHNSSNAAEPVKLPVQRFVPVNADRAAMLWSGFFALDTETGQLCRTFAEFEFDKNAFSQLPSCVSLSRATSAPKSSFQKF
jgi:hypothetical protein